MHVEHEVDESAFELRSQAPIDRKPRARNLCGALQIENAEFGSEVPMRFGLEIEFPRLTAPADFDVIFRALAHRNGFVRKVGNARRQLTELFVERLDLVIERRDSAADLTHLLLPFGSVGSCLTQAGDLAALGIAARL